MLFYCVDEKLGYWFTYVMVNLSHHLYKFIYLVSLTWWFTYV